MAIYSISRIGKNISVKNTSSEDFTLNVQFDGYCSEGCENGVFVTLLNKVIHPDMTESLLFNDGKYRVSIIKGSVTIDTLEYNIYEELRASVISSVFENFCDTCHAESCCRNQDRLDLLLGNQLCVEEILTYSLLKEYASNSTFTKYLQTAFNFYKCKFTIIERENRNFLKFLGRNNNKYDLFGKFALIYLTGFYLMDSLEDVNNISYLCSLYKVSDLRICATKYGIMVEDLEDFFLQSINSDITTGGMKNTLHVETINQLPVGIYGFTSGEEFTVDSKIFNKGTAYTYYNSEDATSKSQILVLTPNLIATRYCNELGIWSAFETLITKTEVLELIQGGESTISEFTGTKYSTFNNQLIEF